MFCIPDATWEEDHGYSWSCATWDHQSLCLQPPNASVLATFKTLLCILGAWFATSSRWMTMCNLPVGIAASFKAMHGFNLDSNFGAARSVSQPQGCYNSTSLTAAQRCVWIVQGGSKVRAAQPCCKSVSNTGHTSSVFGLF